MTIIAKEERADELIDEVIPDLESQLNADGSVGTLEQLQGRYEELLELSEQLLDRNRYSYSGVPEECKSRLYELDALKSNPPESDAPSDARDDRGDVGSAQMVDNRSVKDETDDDNGSELYEVIEPSVTFDDIVGLEGLKRRFREAVEAPLNHPERLRKLSIEMPKGMVLYGPPGNGKTELCKATANELDATVLKVKGSDVVSKYVGEPEQNVARLFSAVKDRQPCIVVMDEVDQLLTSRGHDDNPTGHDKMVSEFLANMSEVDYDDWVFFVGTTNKQAELDNAATRPGRLNREAYVPLPDQTEREEMLLQSLSDANTSIQQETIANVADETAWYSFADIEDITNEAGLEAYRDGRDCIVNEDLVAAFRASSSSVDREEWYTEEVKYRKSNPKDI